MSKNATTTTQTYHFPKNLPNDSSPGSVLMAVVTFSSELSQVCYDKVFSLNCLPK